MLRGLLGLLAFNLLLASVDLVRPHYLRQTNGPVTRILSGVLPPAESTEQFADRVGQAARAQHLRVSRGRDGQPWHADRFALFPLLVYGGLLLVIGGSALSERTAWWENGVGMRPGQIRPLGHGTGLALRAEVVPSTPEDTQTTLPRDRTVFHVMKSDQEIGRLTLDRLAPSFCAGLLFYATSTEPALLVQAQDAAGRRMSLQMPESGTAQFAELALRFREPESQRYTVVIGLAPGSPLQRYFQQKGNEQYVLVSGRDLTLRLQYTPPSAGDPRPAFLVEAYRDAEAVPFFQQSFQGTSSIEIAGDRYVFTPHYYIVIKFGQDYGIALVLLGAIAVLAGVALSAWRPPRRAWLLTRVNESQVMVTITPQGALEQAAWLEDLAQGLATELSLDVTGVT
jgi:hypothetical protein